MRIHFQKQFPPQWYRAGEDFWSEWHAEEDRRLHVPVLRENFIERVFIMKRWREMIGRGITFGILVEFHARHKLLIMAHSPKYVASLVKLVEEGRSIQQQEGFQMEVNGSNETCLTPSPPRVTTRHEIPTSSFRPEVCS